MGATSRRQARDPAKVEAEASPQTEPEAPSVAPQQPAADPGTATDTQPPSDSEALRLRPERRWAQLGAAAMAQPPGSNSTAASERHVPEPEDPPLLEDDSTALSRPIAQIAMGSLVGAVVVVMVMTVNQWGFPAADRPAQDVFPAATVPAATSPAATSAVGAVTSLLETFDELPISATLLAPWQVTGEGSVAVVPLPTSVDRSVRIKSSASGATTALCRPTGISVATGLRVAFDYLLGRAVVGEVALVTLQTGGAGSIELLIGPTGAPVGVKGVDGGASASRPPAAPPSPPAGSAGLVWQRLVVDVDPGAGSVSWVTHDTSGAETAAGTAAVGVARQALGTVCLHSPAAPAGWIAIDNLIIEG